MSREVLGHKKSPQDCEGLLAAAQARAAASSPDVQDRIIINQPFEKQLGMKARIESSTVNVLQNFAHIAADNPLLPVAIALVVTGITYLVSEGNPAVTLMGAGFSLAVGNKTHALQVEAHRNV